MRDLVLTFSNLLTKYTQFDQQTYKIIKKCIAKQFKVNLNLKYFENCI